MCSVINIPQFIRQYLYQNIAYFSNKFNCLWCSSNDQSLNIFENLNLDDASLTNYLKNQAPNVDTVENVSLNEKNLYAGNFVDVPKTTSAQAVEIPQEVCKKMKDMEELLAAKDTAITALTAELESIRDFTSNPSTLSFGTSTTEYKQYQDEYHNKVSGFLLRKNWLKN